MTTLHEAITLQAGGPGSGRHAYGKSVASTTETIPGHKAAMLYHESRLKEIERGPHSLSPRNIALANAHRDAALHHSFAVGTWKAVEKDKRQDSQLEDGAYDQSALAHIASKKAADLEKGT